MKLGSTIVLKTVVSLMGFAALAFCVLALPRGIASELEGDFDYGFIFIGMYVSAIPFFYALFHALKLLSSIDKNNVFTNSAVQSLCRIKQCALAISALYVLGLPYIFYVADRDDAPGVVAIALVIIGASFVIATSSAVFQKLLQSAIDIKSENDLTV